MEKFNWKNYKKEIVMVLEKITSEEITDELIQDYIDSDELSISDYGQNCDVCVWYSDMYSEQPQDDVAYNVTKKQWIDSTEIELQYDEQLDSYHLFDVLNSYMSDEAKENFEKRNYIVFENSNCDKYVVFKDSKKITYLSKVEYSKRERRFYLNSKEIECVARFDDYEDLKRFLEISTNLQVFRTLNNLSQNELAEISDVTKKTIQSYECGFRNINNSTLQNAVKLAKALGVQPEELLEDVEVE